jgi:hypothetical protein
MTKRMSNTRSTEMTTSHKSKEASEALYQGDAEKAAELFQEAAAEAAPPPVSTDELVRRAAEELVDRAVSMALAGDTWALRVCIGQVAVPVPGVEAGYVYQCQAVLSQLAASRLTPELLALLERPSNASMPPELLALLERPSNASMVTCKWLKRWLSMAEGWPHGATFPWLPQGDEMGMRIGRKLVGRQDQQNSVER